MDMEDRRLLRLPEVLALVGVSRSTLWGMVHQDAFPPPVKIGRRAVAWPVHVVAQWLESLPSARPPRTGP